MKYIIDESQLKPVTHEEKTPMVEAYERVGEEMEGWQSYCAMGKTDPRYAIVSMQEFQHMLMAFDDFVKAAIKHMNPEELEEFNRFKASLI